MKNISFNVLALLSLIPLSASTSMFDKIVLPTADTIQAAYDSDISSLDGVKKSKSLKSTAEKFKNSLLKELKKLQESFDNFQLQFKTWVAEDNTGIIIHLPPIEAQEFSIQKRLLLAQQASISATSKALDLWDKQLDFDGLQEQRAKLKQITARLLDYITHILAALPQ